MTMQSNSYVWCNACDESHPDGACPLRTMAKLGAEHLLPVEEYPNVYEREVARAEIALDALRARADQRREATPLDESLLDSQRIAGLMVEQVQELAKRVEMLQAEHAAYKQSFSAEWQRQMKAERAHIVEVLSAFVHAPISISSLQPVLDLAVELNPSLKERR